MAKSLLDAVLDTAFARIQGNADLMTVCSQAPANFSEAQSTYALGQRAIGSNHFTIGDGDVSGRKITIAAQNSVGITTSGHLNHLAILNTASQEMQLLTTVESQYVNAGANVNVPAFDDEILDPS